MHWCLASLVFWTLVVEGVVGRSGIAYQLLPSSDMGTLYETEEAVIGPNPSPRVVVMGTSRGRGAFLPTRMEEKLGLRRGEVLNLSMGGIHIQDALWLYERNRGRLSKANWIVVQADPFQFSSGIEPAFRFRQMASLEERLAYGGRWRVRLLADVVYQTDLAVPHLSAFASSVYRTGKRPEKAGLDPYGRLAYASLEDDHNDAEFSERMLLHRIAYSYAEYEYSPVFEGDFIRLARMVREDGGRLVLFFQPLTADYLRLLRREKGPVVENFKARMQALSGQYGFETLFWEKEDAGLVEGDFRNGDHVNMTGARKFSDAFAGWLGERMKSRARASTFPKAMKR